MADPMFLAAFVASGTGFALLWGRLLWYLTERAGFVHALVLHLMVLVKSDAGEVRGLLLTAAYLTSGVAGALFFAFVSGLPLADWLAFRPEHLGFAAVGVVGEVSLCNLLVSLYVIGLGAAWVQFAEVAEIPWIDGLRSMSRAAALLLAASAAAVEELFFRGVILLVLTEVMGVPAIGAIVAAGVMFWLQQIVQVRTRFQAVVISAGCLSISLVGGMLVVATGTVVPAVICHATFVLFFLRLEGANVRPGRHRGARATGPRQGPRIS
jgi:hypothetical protein